MFASLILNTNVRANWIPFRLLFRVCIDSLVWSVNIAQELQLPMPLLRWGGLNQMSFGTLVCSGSTADRQVVVLSFVSWYRVFSKHVWFHFLAATLIISAKANLTKPYLTQITLVCWGSTPDRQLLVLSFVSFYRLFNKHVWFYVLAAAYLTYFR